MSLSAEMMRQTAWAPLDGEDVERLIAEKQQPPDAVPTPFPSLNAVCRDEGGGIGFGRGQHITIAMRSGGGKSIMGANLIRSAVLAGEHVGIVNLEMSQRQSDTRFLAIASGEPIRALEPGHTFRPDAVRRALGRVQTIQQETGGRVYRSPELLHGIEDIEGAITFLRDGPPACRFVVVDYIQLAGDPNDPASITDVSHRIRQLARDLDVTTVGLSQFNRETFRRGTAPTIHDLMGGSAIENDSDMVLLLDHTRLERAPAPLHGWDSFLVVGKNRHGPAVEIPIRFDSTTLRFSEIRADELPAERRP